MSMLNRKTQKEQTRKKLIETSLSTFATHGISKTSTVQLAKYADVSHGTLFLHFPKRDDLLTAVMHEFGNQLASRFDDAASSSKGGLAHILNAHLQTLAIYEDFYTHLIIELPHLPESVKSRFFILQASISHRIYLEAKKEMMRGKIKSIERHILFNTWIALLHYYLANKKLFTPEKSLIASKGPGLLKHFLFLLKKEISNEC